MFDIKFKIATDTASISIFDEDALLHRTNASADWWADPDEEVLEVNRGNVIFVDLGTDGTYTVYVHLGAHQVETKHVMAQIDARVKCLSGHLFFGAGEDVISAGGGPGTNLGGQFLNVSPGVYHVTLARIGRFELDISLGAVAGMAKNSIQNSLTL